MDAKVQTIVYDKIREKCGTGFTGEELTGDVGINTLSMDSLTILEVIYELEEHFDTTVEEHLLSSMRTVEDLVKMFDDSVDHNTISHWVSST